MVYSSQKEFDFWAAAANLPEVCSQPMMDPTNTGVKEVANSGLGKLPGLSFPSVPQSTCIQYSKLESDIACHGAIVSIRLQTDAVLDELVIGDRMIPHLHFLIWLTRSS
jgi:hypothetical protein